MTTAIKFSPQEREEDKTEALHTEKKKDQVVFQILDNGCGMDEETKNHIFRPISTSGDSLPYCRGKRHVASQVVEKIVPLHKGSDSEVVQRGPVSVPPLR